MSGVFEAQPSKRSRSSGTKSQSHSVCDTSFAEGHKDSVQCPSPDKILGTEIESCNPVSHLELQETQPLPAHRDMHVNYESSQHFAIAAKRRHIVLPGELAQRLEAAKPVVYMAGGMLPQTSWKLRRSGVMLVVDLWSGFGGTVLALLSMGAQVIAVSAECDPEVGAIAHLSMPNTVQVDDVSKIGGVDLLAVIKRRAISVVLIGGGAPCQGNSALNMHRQGTSDPRTVGAAHVARIERELRAAAEKMNVALPPVGTWIENVASAQRSVIDFYSDIIGGGPILINADQFGFVQRNRLFWGQIDGRVIGPEQAKDFADIGMDWQHCTYGAKTPKVLYKGKPFPRSVRLAGGYKFAIQPDRICEQGGKGAMCAFSREFPHPEDRMSQASAQAQQRFLQDQKRFPPGAYEPRSLAWKGESWRTFTSCERAQIMGWPYEALQESILRPVDQDWQTGERKRNSYIGNGFHAPSVMIFLAMLLQVIDCVDVPPLLYPEGEAQLRARIRGTPWEPGFCIPGTLDAHALLDEIRSQFEDVDFQRAGRPRMWKRAKDLLEEVDLKSLQVFWMTAVLQGCNPLELAPEWRDQKHKAMHAASIRHKEPHPNPREGYTLFSPQVWGWKRTLLRLASSAVHSMQTLA